MGLDGENAMSDLYVAVAVVWLTAVVCFVIASRWAVQTTRRARSAMAVIVLLAGAGYVLYVRDSTLLTAFLPFSSLIILSCWFSVFCGILAGLAWQQAEASRLSRLWPVIALAALGVFSTIHPLLGAAPVCHDRWEGNVCLQSSWHSCSAACAATLLTQRGIDATEAELVELCLTRKGTTWQGLYRGLTMKTAGTEWRVEVSETSVADLRDYAVFPAILSVGVPVGVDVDPVYTDSYGWPPGQLHSVVLFGFDSDGNPQIGDPSVGRESWSAADLKVLYRGTVVRLVPR